jgi:LmbE family N-acetylglucosaminyl deacetylase
MIKVVDLHRRWRTLPKGTLDEIVGRGNCLVLAPHPDDESLGCGGLIAACCTAGRPPVVAILTDGSGSHPGSLEYPPARRAALRGKEVTEAVGHLGVPVEHLILLGESDGHAPREGAAFGLLTRRLAAWIVAFDCTTILVPWRHDPHRDHEAAALIGEAAARFANVRLLAYPVWGWMLPRDGTVADHSLRGWRFDIQAYLPAKRRAIAAHASQAGRVIHDDPSGFELPKELLQIFDQPWETFLLP